MREQSSILSVRMLAGAVSALALLFSPSPTRAGDPIQFSNDKAKPTPSDARPVDTDVFKSWNKSKAPASPLNSLTPFITPGRATDPKEERRLKNIREEKKNWMLLEPGELQKREEEEERQFGGKSVAIDDMNDDEGGNYLFYNVTQQKSDRPQNNAPRSTESEDQPKKDTRSLSIFGPREVEQPGAHTASELNLKGLIDPSQVDATRINNNEPSLFQFLKDNAAPPPDRDQQKRRDNFRDFINGPQPNTASSGISDPINFRTDLTQERLNPIMPSRPAFDLPAATKAPDAFSDKPPLAGTFAPPRAPGLPEIVTTAPRQPTPGPYLPSPLLMQNDASKAPRASVMGNNSLFNREAPRRGGL